VGGGGGGGGGNSGSFSSGRNYHCGTQFSPVGWVPGTLSTELKQLGHSSDSLFISI